MSSATLGCLISRLAGEFSGEPAYHRDLRRMVCAREYRREAGESTMKLGASLYIAAHPKGGILLNFKFIPTAMS